MYSRGENSERPKTEALWAGSVKTSWYRLHRRHAPRTGEWPTSHAPSEEPNTGSAYALRRSISPFWPSGVQTVQVVCRS